MTISMMPSSFAPISASSLENRAYPDFAVDLSASLDFTIYAASRVGYASEPTDSPPSTPFRGVLQSYSFARSILQNDIGVFTTGTGQLVLDNTDAAYDFLPRAYSIDGRAIRLNVGEYGADYNSVYPLARVTSTGWVVDIDAVTIDLVDYSYKLDVPLQPNLYGGTGAADGGADLAGKRVPLAFGSSLSVPAVFLVPASLIYQVHESVVQAITAVYDSGVALTFTADFASYALLAAASVSSGHYSTCLAAGLFKLGVSPAGQVTADVQGAKPSGSYLQTTADIVRWAVANRTTLVDPDDLDTGSFDTVNSTQGAPIDYWVGPDDSITVAAFVANVMGGIGGWGGHNRAGKFEVRIFSAPVGAPSRTFTRADMFNGDIKREQLPSNYSPPPWRWRVPYQRCNAVQTNLTTAATAAYKAFAAAEVRLAEAQNTAVIVDYPGAQDPDPVNAYFSNQTDAAAEATRRLNLFKASAAIYRAFLPRRALRLELGSVIEVTHPRFDLQNGRLMTVVELKENVTFAANAVDWVEVAAYG